MIDFKALAAPFPENDIEWRIQSSGINNNGKVWAKCLAYITNRAIMDRLDEIVGPANWKNQFAPGPLGGIICGISIKIDGEWVEKWDGADETDIEKVKGGLSGAMKRAGVQWGIGRFLYDLEPTWAQISDNGKFSAKTKDGTWFKWDAPKLPAWALPAPPMSRREQSAAKVQPRPEPESVQPQYAEGEIAPSGLDKVVETFAKIDNLVHLSNHWKAHFAEYQKDPLFDAIVVAKDKRKAELSTGSQQENFEPTEADFRKAEQAQRECAQTPSAQQEHDAAQITAGQAKELEALAKDVGVNIPAFLKTFKVDSFQAFTIADMKKAAVMLSKRKVA